MSAETADHADSEREEIDRAKRIIARILAMREGQGNAISSDELAERTPVAATTVRDRIPEIIAEYQIPIASCPDGYYRVSSHKEFLAEIERYESQRRTARQRMQALSAAYYGDEGGVY